MNAALMTACGEPEVMQYGQITRPKIEKDSQVLVRLKAAGVNPVDTKIRQGYLPVQEFPAILGCDGAGIIEAIGAEVKHLQISDEVYFFHAGLGTLPGNYAEYTVLDERYVVKKPESIDFVEAAAAPLVLITAWESLHDRACIKAGQTVLIHAGAGGVGHVAIQIAKLAGARVLATVSSKEKADFVGSLGADEAILYKDNDFVSEVMRLTKDVGADIVMDNVGGALFQNSFSAVRHYGDLVSLLLPGNDVDWTTARMRNLRISLDLMLTPFLLGLEDRLLRQKEIMEHCSELLESKKLKLHVSKTFKLEQVAEAHKQIETGSTTGKIVLKI